MEPGFELILAAPGHDSRVVALEDGGNLVGRWDPESKSFPEIDLTELDPEVKVSRKHALVTLDEGGLTLEDLGSRNGTFLRDGTKVEPGRQYKLKDGEEFFVGKVVLKVRIKV